jgi:probable phosphoglycerate mutase
VGEPGREIVIVRHGETEWTLSRQHTGTTDIPLTDNGRRQAEAVATRLAGRNFDLVLSSPLSRALETCRLAGLGEAPEITDDLLEWNYGRYEAITTAEIRKTDPDWDLWRDGCPDGENAAQVGARADRVIARLRDLDGSAVVFGHGHLLRVLAARWIEQPPELGGRLALSTATIGVLGWERETPVIWRWNDGAHLEDG